MDSDDVAAAFEQLDRSGLSSVLHSIDNGSLDAGVLIRIPTDRQPYKQVRFNMVNEMYGRFVGLFRDGFGNDMSQVMIHCAIVGLEQTELARGVAFDPFIEKIAAEQNAMQYRALNDAIEAYSEQLTKYEGEPKEIARSGLERLHEQCVRKGLTREARRIEHDLDR